jgi:hypothetical protein
VDAAFTLALAAYKPDPAAQAAGSRCVKGKWRIVEMPDYEDDFDMVEPAYILFDGKGGGEFAFGCVTGSLHCATRRPLSSPGMETTKWTRPAATDGPSFSPTARSQGKSASMAATKPTSPRVPGRLLQQPAKGTFGIASLLSSGGGDGKWERTLERV